MKIYTKTGDKGETGIIGSRVKKDSFITKTLGSIDEFNASLGICIANIKLAKLKVKGSKELQDNLLEIQKDIFSIGATVAGGKSKVDFEKRVKFLESEIDRLDLDLDPIQNFILPGGTILSSYIHFSRTLCRKAEREFVSYLSGINDEGKKEKENILKYLNRLSDYLFTLARYINKLENIEDIIWK